MMRCYSVAEQRAGDHLKWRRHVGFLVWAGLCVGVGYV